MVCGQLIRNRTFHSLYKNYWLTQHTDQAITKHLRLKLYNLAITRCFFRLDVFKSSFLLAFSNSLLSPSRKKEVKAYYGLLRNVRRAQNYLRQDQLFVTLPCMNDISNVESDIILINTLTRFLLKSCRVCINLIDVKLVMLCNLTIAITLQN